MARGFVETTQSCTCGYEYGGFELEFCFDDLKQHKAVHVNINMNDFNWSFVTLH
jgi:hypothetical protein